MQILTCSLLGVLVSNQEAVQRSSTHPRKYKYKSQKKKKKKMIFRWPQVNPKGRAAKEQNEVNTGFFGSPGWELDVSWMSLWICLSPFANKNQNLFVDGNHLNCQQCSIISYNSKFIGYSNIQSQCAFPANLRRSNGHLPGNGHQFSFEAPLGNGSLIGKSSQPESSDFSNVFLWAEYPDRPIPFFSLWRTKFRLFGHLYSFRE